MLSRLGIQNGQQTSADFVFKKKEKFKSYGLNWIVIKNFESCDKRVFILDMKLIPICVKYY